MKLLKTWLIAILELITFYTWVLIAFFPFIIAEAEKNYYLLFLFFISVPVAIGLDYHLRHRTIQKPYWVSIKRAKNCLFSRRYGHKGKLFFGWSICVRLFGYDIL